MNFEKSEGGCRDTHRVNNLPIPAMVYYINTLDIQLCRRGRGVSTILYVGDVFYGPVSETVRLV